jgi:DNA-binding response OmpR family regulator
MAKTTSIRILHVGRRSNLTEELRAIIDTPEPVSLKGDGALGYRLDYDAVTSQKAALRRIRSMPPHIILVETEAKYNSRARFCEMVRYRLPTAAIIAVGETAPQGTFAFDDFIPTPLVRKQVLSVILHICIDCADYHLNLDPIHLNIATRMVKTPSGRYPMTPKQCQLLQLLMDRNGEVVSRGEIMETVWKTGYMEDTRTLDVHIRWLRECIEPEPSRPRYLTTVRGVGYKLSIPTDE